LDTRRWNVVSITALQKEIGLVSSDSESAGID